MRQFISKELYESTFTLPLFDVIVASVAFFPLICPITFHEFAWHSKNQEFLSKIRLCNPLFIHAAFRLRQKNLIVQNAWNCRTEKRSNDNAIFMIFPLPSSLVNSLPLNSLICVRVTQSQIMEWQGWDRLSKTKGTVEASLTFQWC